MICYLALGSNLKHPRRQLCEAISRLSALPRTVIIKISDVYFNPAVGRRSQPPFCNMVIKISTQLPVDALLRYCNAIEKVQNRVRKLKWGARTLDIDILYYGDLTINLPHLVIPHPRMHERDFVLLPLSQVMLTPGRHCTKNP